jgi:HSP20 family protein
MSLLRRVTDTSPALSRQQAWDPFEVMQQMLRWDPFRELAMPTLSGPAFNPAFEVKETKDSFVFTADLPGVKEEELDVSIAANRVTVSGQRTAEKREENDSWFTCERAYGAFSRTFSLPEGADVDHAEAELKNGVLTVVVPKKQEARPRRLSLKRLFAKGEEKKA